MKNTTSKLADTQPLHISLLFLNTNSIYNGRYFITRYLPLIFAKETILRLCS